MKSYRFHPEADEEYAVAAAHYAAVRPELGVQFFDEIEGVIADIRGTPRRYRRVDGDVRRHLAETFPFAILYLDEPDSIWIVAVMPLKRDPDYWKHRLNR